MSWTTVNNGLPYSSSTGFAFSGTNIFAATKLNGVYLSTNNGAEWTSAGNLVRVSAIVISGTNIFAGTPVHYGGIFLSTDNGSNWTLVRSGLPSPYGVDALMASGTNIFAGNWAGVFLSANNGTNWNAVNSGMPDGTSVFSLAKSGTIIFAGTSNGVFYTNNNGANWINKNLSVDFSPYVSELLVANGYIFAVKDRTSLWRRSLQDVVGIQNTGQEIPSAYSLMQNYPNPFNPSTVIRFGIPSITVGQTFLFVTLKVYDIAGHEVRTLINKSLQPGTYETTFDGSKLNSGIYFYRAPLKTSF